MSLQRLIFSSSDKAVSTMKASTSGGAWEINLGPAVYPYMGPAKKATLGLLLVILTPIKVNLAFRARPTPGVH